MSVPFAPRTLLPHFIIATGSLNATVPCYMRVTIRRKKALRERDSVTLNSPVHDSSSSSGHSSVSFNAEKATAGDGSTRSSPILCVWANNLGYYAVCTLPNSKCPNAGKLLAVYLCLCHHPCIRTIICSPVNSFALNQTRR